MKFLLAFIFLVGFAVGNFLVINQEIRHAERGATVLSFLEGQYNQIQKTTFLSTAYAQAMDAKERKILRINTHEELASLLVFDAASDDIISRKTQLLPELIPALRDLYFSSSAPLNREVEEYFFDLKKFLISSPTRVRPDNAQLLAFQEK
ncbi:MAG: hypothetical protein WC527_08980, partial [Candidatus Margulisiibacteriota bacterium]